MKHFSIGGIAVFICNFAVANGNGYVFSAVDILVGRTDARADRGQCALAAIDDMRLRVDAWTSDDIRQA